MSNSRGTRARDASRSSGASIRARIVGELPVEERRVDLGGIPTSILEGGEGAPLVLLQGLIQAGGVVWSRSIPRLASRYRVIVPDLPGLGESGSGSGSADLDRIVEWLGDLIGATCPEPPILVAHSAGGAFAARFAIARGARLRQLVLVDSAGLYPRPSFGFLTAAIRNARRPSPKSFERLMRRATHDLDGLRGRAGERWESFAAYAIARAEIPGVKEAMNNYATRSNLKAIPDAELTKIPVRTDLIWGRNDRAYPLKTAESAAARLKWPLHIVEEAGHLPHVEQPQPFADTLNNAVAGS